MTTGIVRRSRSDTKNLSGWRYEEPLGREHFGDVRAEMNPAAIAAGHNHRRSAAWAVEMKRLRVPANDDRRRGLSRRGTGGRHHAADRPRGETRATPGHSDHRS